MDRTTRRLFNVIFQEAEVLDFDFCKWDRYVRLVVLGGLLPENFNGRGPLRIHNVDFLDVAELMWKSMHLGIVLESPRHHCQWTIMEFKVVRKGKCKVITLSGFGPSPRLRIVCRDVKITEMWADVVDALNPHWNAFSAPLARPSLEELGKRMRRPQHPRGRSALGERRKR